MVKKNIVLTLIKVEKKTLMYKVFITIVVGEETIAIGERDQLNSKYSKDSWKFEQ